MKTCCFTGHRPQKLPWGYNEADERCAELKNKLIKTTEKAIHKGYEQFISGMALGTDVYFAEAVLRLKENYPHIKLECAIPYIGQCAAYWPEAHQKRYYALIEKCDIKTLLSKKYYRGCLMARNRYMVDQSSFMIAVYNQALSGGTYSTIKYARKAGVAVDYIIIDA